MLRKQIKADINFLENLVKDLSGDHMTVTSNGKPLKGAKLRASLDSAAEEQKSEISKLKAMLASRVTPEVYTSPITKQTYVRSADEEVTTENLPNASYYSFAGKDSRKSNNGLSKWTIFKDDRSIIAKIAVEHRDDKDYPKGGIAEKVKKGFIKSDQDPKYAIKIFQKKLFKDDTAHELRLAMHAGYCARLLGRTGLAFRANKKQYFITDWHKGTNLHKYDPVEIKKIPIEDRIKLTLDLVEQIKILHQNNLIHCDIKPLNVIMSPDAIYLIDLDSVRFNGENPRQGQVYTPRFMDAQHNWDAEHHSKYYKDFNKKSDMYALGLTLGYLFPELLDPTYSKKTANADDNSTIKYQFDSVNLHYGDAYKDHKALADLIVSTINPDRSERPSAESFFSKLNDIYSKTYGKKYEPTLINSHEKTGKKAYKAMEAEIHEFNYRADTLRKK